MRLRNIVLNFKAKAKPLHSKIDIMGDFIYKGLLCVNLLANKSNK